MVLESPTSKRALESSSPYPHWQMKTHIFWYKVQCSFHYNTM